MPALLLGLLTSTPAKTLFFCALCGLACYLWGYARGSATAALQCENQARTAQAEFQRVARETESAVRAEQGRIAAEYQKDLEELRHEQEELQSRLERYRLADAVHLPAVSAESERVQCPSAPAAKAIRVSRGAKARGGFACYSEDRLRRKVAESVAIGQECDREMTRFRKLIEACHGR